MWASSRYLCNRKISFVSLVLLWAPVFLARPTHGLAPVHRSLVIVGVGRVGREVMRQASGSQSFDSVQGVSPRNWELARNDLECPPEAKTCTHLLVTIPPNVGETICDAIVQEMGSRNSSVWMGILSTTGVYGNHDGAWVTEDSVCHNTTSSSTSYIDFERQWKHRVQTFCRESNYEFRIFRCAGIYGPDASALHTVRRKGMKDFTASNRTDDVTNRIHIEDLAAAVLNSMMLHSCHDDDGDDDVNPGSQVRIYNLADDLPASRMAVLAYGATVLRKKGLLSEEGWNGESNGASAAQEPPSKRSRRRLFERKRVDNRRMKDELLPRLRYPTYKEGLAAILLSNRTQWQTVT